MNHIIRLDAWLITNLYEPLSWWTEYHYNKDCFWLGKASMTLSMLASIIGATKGMELNPIFILFWGLLWFTFMNVFTEHERSVRRSPQHVNHWREKWPLRFAVVGLCLFVSLDQQKQSSEADTIYRMLLLLGEFLLVNTYYFQSCNPMPPKWRLTKRLRLQTLSA